MQTRCDPGVSESSIPAAAWGRARQHGRDVRRRFRPAEEPARTLFVLGCQRSGTTMLMQAFGRDPDVKTFGEYSPLNHSRPGLGRFWPQHTRRYDQRLLPESEVARRLARERYPLVVAKPLVESQRARALLDGVPGSRAAWLFRDFQDVAMSNVEKFGIASVRRTATAMATRDPANWRSEFVPDDVGELVDAHYRPDMSPYDAAALFWYARSRLYFDQALDREPRVRLVEYEDLVRHPERALADLYRHAGARWPGAEVAAHIHAGSVGRAPALELAPAIRRACEQLWAQLSAAWQQQVA